jgi:plastocyanin domain-containing protein
MFNSIILQSNKTRDVTPTVEGGLDPHTIKIWKMDFKLMHFIL